MLPRRVVVRNPRSAAREVHRVLRGTGIPFDESVFSAEVGRWSFKRLAALAAYVFGPDAVPPLRRVLEMREDPEASPSGIVVLERLLCMRPWAVDGHLAKYLGIPLRQVRRGSWSELVVEEVMRERPGLIPTPRKSIAVLGENYYVRE